MFKRIVFSIGAIFAVFTITFILMHCIPGNAFADDKSLSPEIMEHIKQKYGLDQPIQCQYTKMLANLLRLDFGVSIKNSGQSINTIIFEHFPISAELGLVAIFISIIFGIFFGTAAAYTKDSWVDYSLLIVLTICLTVPNFVVAALLQYFLGVKIRLFPIIGLSSIRHGVLPVLTISFYPTAFIARLVRASMIETFGEEYITAARARGLKEPSIVFKHALKNSLLTVIAYMGPLLAGILSGSFIVETVFNIPGLGRYFIDSITNRDYPMILGVTVFYSILLILSNLLVDVMYTQIDPRIRFDA
jgi:oligopeptide transport system permease protein